MNATIISPSPSTPRPHLSRGRLAILVLAAGVLVTSSCSSTTPVATTVKTSQSTAQPMNPRISFRSGDEVTVIQKDGAIRAFTVTGADAHTVYGKDATSIPVSIPINDLDSAKVSASSGGKAGSTLLGAFAKTGKVTGKVAITILTPVAYVLSGGY